MARYAKAIVGAVIAFLSSMAVSLQDSSAAGSSITAAEWVTAAIGFFSALAVIWAVPNSPPS